jgi:hypothetical protein
MWREMSKAELSELHEGRKMLEAKSSGVSGLA